MSESHLTTQVLIEIREEIRGMRTDLGERIDQTNARLDQTNARLDQTNVHLTEVEIRLATEITEVASAITDLTALLRNQAEVRAKVDDHEARIRALEQRTAQ